MSGSNRVIGDRDKKIAQAKKDIQCIRRDVESLKIDDSEMDFTTIEETIDALEEIIQNLPEKIPDITIIARHLKNMLQHLKGVQSNVNSLDDIETRLGILCANIHVVGLMQKVIQDPERRAIAPKGKIWKDVKACYPKFMGFKLRVIKGATRLYEKASTFYIEFKKKNAEDEEISKAMEAFLPHLKSFVAWEMVRYQVGEYHKIWYNNSLGYWMMFCDFRDEDNWDDYTR
jgi:hypothetical protein